jgi:hypothetical protein
MAATDETDDEPPLAAGDFSAWLAGMVRALDGRADSDVPCAGCTACCTSSQFVHVGPDETDALAHIPVELQFPAPGRPHGHVVVGYDEHGHCPMLIAGACSIYEHRPRTCRTYDCRVFAAADVEPDDDKPAIARRVRRWRFAFPDDGDRVAQRAVAAAAAFVRGRASGQPDALTAVNATQRAVLAVELHSAFLAVDEPEPDVLLALLAARGDSNASAS